MVGQLFTASWVTCSSKKGEFDRSVATIGKRNTTRRFSPNLHFAGHPRTPKERGFLKAL
jgi:hypothetical protein